MGSTTCITSEAEPPTTIHVAMECNNVGCDLLALNDASSAMELFSVALKLLRTITQAQLDPHFHVDHAKLIVQSHDQARLLMTSVHPRSCDYRRHREGSSSSAIKFASRAIKMKFGLCSSVAMDSSYFRDNSTILLYNMGLACLVHGAPPMLSKSLTLFDMAYKLGIDAVSGGTSSITTTTSHTSHDDHICTLQRICLDSLHFSAHLHHTNADFDMSERILIKIRQLIRQLPPTQDPQEQRRRHHFWILKDLLRKPTLAPAA
jgi:hypothetical protein